MNFKDRFLSGECRFNAIEDYMEQWHTTPENGQNLNEFLGLTEQEYGIYLRESNTGLEKVLLTQRKQQKFRIYQLEFSTDLQAKPFAFLGIEALHKAGYEQPPAAEYRLVHDGVFLSKAELSDSDVLDLIFRRYNDDVPEDYQGRSLAPSDIIELYDEQGRCYFYRNPNDFTEVKFSPVLALPMEKQV